MGDWRTVNILGAMKPEEAKEMIKELRSDDIWETPAWGFAINFSLCGLNQWVKENGDIIGIGNLAERDCEIEDIEIGLEYLVSKYPSIELTLHAGDNYESKDCVATFEVHDGIVEKKEPQIACVRTRW